MANLEKSQRRTGGSVEFVAAGFMVGNKIESMIAVTLLQAFRGPDGTRKKPFDDGNV